MAINTYQTLQDAVANWVHRPGDATITARIMDCISLVESRMSADLSGRSMELRATLTCVPSVAYVTLPTDIVEIRRLLLSSTTPQTTLKYVTPDNISKDYAYGSVGQPVIYTVNGAQVQLAPVPDTAYSLELSYYQKVPPLSTTNTTNWLLAGYPNVYLYGTLAELMVYLQDANGLAINKKLYLEAVDVVNKIDWYTGSTMIVRAS